MKLPFTCLLGVLCFAQSARCDDPTAVCLAMIKEAANNISMSTSSATYLNTIFSSYCRSDGSTTNSAMDVGLTAIIEEIPTTFKGNSNDAQTSYTNFCKNYASTAAGSSSSYTYQSTVITKALESANQCLAIAKSGSYITYKAVSRTLLSIDFAIGPRTSLDIRDITPDRSVTCIGKKLGGPGEVNYGPSIGQNLPANTFAYSVTCNRVSTHVSPAGEKLYPEAGIVVSTNAGTLAIYWPPDKELPVLGASEIEASLKTLNQQLATVQTVASGAQAKIQTAVSNYGPELPGTSGTGNGGTGVIQNSTTLGCPNGQYLSGLKLDWAGTCQNACSQDGGVLHVVTAICKALF
jgi:hypothetical protein